MDTERIDIATAVVEAMAGCPVLVTGGSKPELTGFETNHCFNPDLQPSFTAGWLADFAARMDRRIVQELQEPLGLTITMAWLGDRLVVIGPYCHQPVRTGDAERLLGRLRIPSAYLQLYTLYRAGYPIVDSEFVTRGVLALAAVIGLSTADFGYERVSADAGPIPATAEPPTPAVYDVINARYACELEFMDAVTAGDDRRARATLAKMANLPRPSWQYLNNPYLGATILRIMTRVAALRAGLPPVTIDAVSQTYAQQLHRAGHSPDTGRATEANLAMVAEFCRHIRRHRQRPYSPLVRQAIDEIELHLSHNVAPHELARRLHVSESHLARQFKSETGQTITGYTARERMDLAARLLITTRQSIADIAAYVGYLDANYFVKVFRSVHQTTPSDYRRQGGGSRTE